MVLKRQSVSLRACRSPHGERGLKYLIRMKLGLMMIGRSPHGERGLKCIEILLFDLH